MPSHFDNASRGGPQFQRLLHYGEATFDWLIASASGTNPVPAFFGSIRGLYVRNYDTLRWSPVMELLRTDLVAVCEDNLKQTVRNYYFESTHRRYGHVALVAGTKAAPQCRAFRMDAWRIGIPRSLNKPAVNAAIEIGCLAFLSDFNANGAAK